MQHRTLKTAAVATAGGAALVLGAMPAQAGWAGPVRPSCVTAAHVRHAAMVEAGSAGYTIFVRVRADAGVNSTLTTIKPGNARPLPAVRGGRNVNFTFRSNVTSYRVWLYMNGRGGACTAYVLTRAYTT